MKILEERKWTLATAESCTGGMVASRIVDYAGASKAFVNGMVTYTNESKSRLLGVKCDTLEKWEQFLLKQQRKCALVLQKSAIQM